MLVTVGVREAKGDSTGFLLRVRWKGGEDERELRCVIGFGFGRVAEQRWLERRAR